MIVFLIANTILTTILWIRSVHHPDGPPIADRGKFLTDQLNFDSLQREQFEIIKADYFNRLDELKEKEHQLKDEFFDLIKTDSVSNDVIINKARATAALKFQIDTMMLKHFIKIKSICNKQQIESLNKVIDNLAKQPNPFPGRRPLSDSQNHFIGPNQKDNDAAIERNSNRRPLPPNRNNDFHRPPPPDLMEEFGNENNPDFNSNQRPPHPRPPKRPEGFPDRRPGDKDFKGEMPDGPPPPGPPPVN